LLTIIFKKKRERERKNNEKCRESGSSVPLLINTCKGYCFLLYSSAKSLIDCCEAKSSFMHSTSPLAAFFNLKRREREYGRRMLDEI
jgi:hypothetical protein